MAVQSYSRPQSNTRTWLATMKNARVLDLFDLTLKPILHTETLSSLQNAMVSQYHLGLNHVQKRTAAL